MQNLVELRFRKTNKLIRKTCFPKFCTSPSAETLADSLDELKKRKFIEKKKQNLTKQFYYEKLFK